MRTKEVLFLTGQIYLCFNGWDTTGLAKGWTELMRILLRIWGRKLLNRLNTLPQNKKSRGSFGPTAFCFERRLLEDQDLEYLGSGMQSVHLQANVIEAVGHWDPVLIP